ncbi:DUF2141 domain-containing protein [Pseudocolwellia sp. HL-MZ7]|uniref:DUF2141 domain-containing protein n=1 Tax=Pseudocolwellia sp. HL-MZ7 TaxID=3400627 RepID=UPI003CECD48B
MAQSTQDTFKLTVLIKKLKTTETPIKIELLQLLNDENNDWELTNLVQTKLVYLSEKKLTVEFDQLKHGYYAVRAFQDKNLNNKLDKSALLIPKEPVAFSQNPSLFKGEPTPDKAVFIIEADTLISLSFKHPRKKKVKKHR